MHGHSLTWFSLIPVVRELPAFLSGAIFVGILLMIMGAVISLKLKREQTVAPPDKISFITVIELLVEGIYGFAENIMGKEGKKYVHIVGGLFIFILTCNLLGMIPGFSAPTGYPTDDFVRSVLISPNFACAILVYFLYNYYGIKAHGIKYIKHFAGPLIWLAPFMFGVEMISHLVRPVSLSVRLFANMMADHTAVGVVSSLVPVGIPVLFLVLGLVVSFIQAFIFSLLTMVYIMLATQSEH
ncbi:MAG TPA: F0F1 ATP synthase subunit A [bacterium]